MAPGSLNPRFRRIGEERRKFGDLAPGGQRAVAGAAAMTSEISFGDFQDRDSYRGGVKVQ